MKTSIDEHFEDIIIYFRKEILNYGDDGLKVITLIIVESYFRNKQFLILELLYWLFCYSFNRKAVNTISIGYSQVQIRHWISLGYFDSIQPTLEKFKIALNYSNNYRVCSNFLESRIDLSNANSIEIQKAYRGVKENYYDYLYKYYFQRICKLSNELKKANCA